MSDHNTPADQPSQGDQPSQEELEAYLEQLRQAEADEVVAQAYTMLGTGAEVKLGRPDARVLIDAMAAMTEAVAAGIEESLATRMRNGVVQLQNAQVQAERQGSGGEAAKPTAPPAAPGASPASAPTDAGAAQPSSSQEQGSAADRLWIPGRGQG